MKKIILIFLLLKFSCSFSQTTYVKYCPESISRPYYLPNGMSYQFQNFYDSGITSMAILKNDLNGNVLWHRSYFKPGSEINVQYFLTLPDGGFAFTGAQVELPDRFQFLLRGDSLGNIIWSKRICNLADQVVVSLVSTLDEGFLIALKDIPFSSQSFLLSLDNSGNLEYYKKIYPDSFVIGDVKQLPDSNFLISGNHERGVDSHNLTLAKINKHGNIIWGQGIGDTINGGDETHFSDQTLTRDGGFVIYGTLNHGNAQRSIFKFNSNGSLLWARALFPITSGWGEPYNDIVETADGALIISYENSYPDIGCMIRTDSSGNLSWSKRFKGYLRSGFCEDPYHGINFCISPTALEGTCIIRIDSSGNVPCADSVGIFADSVFFPAQFNKYMSDSNLTTTLTDFPILDSISSSIVLSDYCELLHNNEENPFIISFYIYPNPVSRQVTVESRLPILDMEFYNMIGEKMLIQKLTSMNDQIAFDVSAFTSGIYFIKIKTEKGISVQKFIKQ